jgi:membrane protease YdiL (CAAX protease family)
MSGRKLLSYLTVAPRFRWRLLLLGLGLSLLVIGPMLALAQLTDPHASPPPLLSLTQSLSGRIVYVVASFVCLIPAAAAEEVVFRGWLLRQSAALTRNPWVLMGINGVLFSAVHGEFAPDPFLTRTLMGAGFVYMTLRLGGVEFSIGAHAANNLLIVLFLQPLTLTSTAPSGFTSESILQDLFLFASYIVMAEVTARWTPLRRWAGVDQPEAPPTTAVAAHFS